MAVLVLVVVITVPGCSGASSGQGAVPEIPAVTHVAGFVQSPRDIVFNLPTGSLNIAGAAQGDCEGLDMGVLRADGWRASRLTSWVSVAQQENVMLDLCVSEFSSTEAAQVNFAHERTFLRTNTDGLSNSSVEVPRVRGAVAFTNSSSGITIEELAFCRGQYVTNALGGPIITRGSPVSNLNAVSKEINSAVAELAQSEATLLPPGGGCGFDG